MNTDFIEFKKKRELGDILSDTFAFLRSQFKPFFNVFLKIVGPYLAVMAISYGFYTYSIGDLVNFTGDNFDFPLTTILTLVVVMVFFFSIIAAYVMAQATTLFYIKSYTDLKGNIDFDTIKKNVYGSFWKFVGLAFLVGLSVGIGFMFCLVPGIYLYVPLALSFSIMVFRQKGTSEAYSDSFGLVKDEWWMAFATLFIVGIIVTIASYAFSMPSTIYAFMKLGILSGEIDATDFTGNLFDPIAVILGIISLLAQFFLSIISLVASALIYFNLNEKKNFTGTYERIQDLGKKPEEETSTFDRIQNLGKGPEDQTN
ncbi:Putative transmembrane protein [hydrothermal vent metagenome]|uniref:Transmembrane protein n=1 Tax=hydrothermal vent metagenome TaxID=652676 RepID=A0A3B0TF64_9ZZZZ